MEFMVIRLQRIAVRFGRIGKFLITGGVSAAVSLGTLALLADGFHVWYLAASVTGYILSFFVNFFLQKLWTFRNTDTERTRVQMGLFLASSLLNLALNTALMYGLVDYLGLNHLLAQALVIGVLAVMNYTLYRLYIFKTEPHEPIH
jgi:putative flippase GtrA